MHSVSGWFAGNFMFHNHELCSRLKAIDFGLARRYQAGELPLTDLGLEGTPWCVTYRRLIIIIMIIIIIIIIIITHSQSGN
jgi:hypothetical protein